VRNDWDDEQLLEALREAMQARQAVPSWFVTMGKNAYAWHNIDAELAQLTYDSLADAEQPAFVRSETALIRALTFTSDRLSLELEVGEDSLLVQVMPPQAGTLETYTKAGLTSSPVDESGYLAVEPLPAGSFRLRFHTPGGADVVTGWITL
jgi:hypothetical protein